MSSKAQPAEVLRGVNRSTRDSSSLPQKSLVVLQAALSLVLISGAVLMTKSLGNLEHQNFGFSTTNRYILGFDPRSVGYTVDRLPALYRQIEDRYSALPGMANVSMVRYTPLGGNNWGSCVIPQGHGAPGPTDDCFSSWDRASTHFLDSIGVPIVRGRNFTAGHGDFARSGDRKPGFCEAILSRPGSDRKTFRPGQAAILGRV
jgi:hypothetical protein